LPATVRQPGLQPGNTDRQIRSHARRPGSELRAQNALDAARDATIAIQWEHHKLILGVKDQVIAQFGADSNDVASLGLKKKSERKAPARAGKPPA
jgi:hypothetical protein